MQLIEVLNSLFITCFLFTTETYSSIVSSYCLEEFDQYDFIIVSLVDPNLALTSCKSILSVSMSLANL